MTISGKDIKIIRILLKDARSSLKQIANKLDMSETGVRYRLDKLEKEGIIKGYSADLDMDKMGKPLGVVFFIRPRQGVGLADLMNNLRELKEILRVYYITGDRPLFAMGYFDSKISLKSFLDDNLISNGNIMDFEYKLILENMLEERADRLLLN